MIAWKERTKKRAIQKEILGNIKQSTLITLGGANISNYVNLIPESVTEIISYERDKEAYISQLIELEHINRNVHIKFGDIEQENVYLTGFYDLDFMCTLPSCAHILKKFSMCAYSLTVSHRPYRIKDLPKQLAEALDVELDCFGQAVGKNYRLIKMSGGQLFRWYTYNDTIPMSTIIKHKN